MANINLEYGKSFEIPVSFESELFTRRRVSGTIFIKKNESYLDAYIYNEDDLLPHAETDEVGVDIIRCVHRDGGSFLYLVNCKISFCSRVYSGASYQYQIYFDYLVTGVGEINASNELQFNRLELDFENLGTWLNPNYSTITDYQLPLAEFDIDALDAKIQFLPFRSEEREEDTNLRVRRTVYDVRVVLLKRKGKFTLKDVRGISLDLQSLFSCLTAEACFCTRWNGCKNRRSPAKHIDRYNILSSSCLAEPRYELKHTCYALIPDPLSTEMNLGEVINANFLKDNEALSGLVRRIASIFLYKNRFLYDVRFFFVATLLETAFEACIQPHEDGAPREKIRFNEKLAEVTPPLSDEQLASIRKLGRRYCKPTPLITLKDKLRKLVEAQYGDCQLVEFTDEELDYIVKNRNSLGHGISFAYQKFNSRDSIFNRLLILVLYTALKALGVASETLRGRLLSSFSNHLFGVDTEPLRFVNADKISIPHGQFVRLQEATTSSRALLHLVVERFENEYRVNFDYTDYLNRDIVSLILYDDIRAILWCYYTSKDVAGIKYTGQAYLIDDSDTDSHLKPFSILIVDLERPFKEIELIRNDSLIPSGAYKLAHSENASALKAYRIFRGLTVTELATVARLSRSTISRYENAHRPPDKNTYLKILKALGTDLSPMQK